MAKIWPVYDGYPNTLGEPWAVMALNEAVRILEIEPSHYLADLSHPPRFGNTMQNLTWVGYRHVIVEVGDDDANDNWRTGFYRSPLAPSKAFYRILQWRIEGQLGRNWRVELEQGSDADGEPAIWAWITLKADAPAATWDRKNRERIESDVRTTISDSGVSYWVFVRFRKESEERAVS